MLLSSAVGPSHTSSLPPPPVPTSGYQCGGAPGLFSFSPANMITAVKQKSAFAPVLRPPGHEDTPPPPMGGMTSGYTNGWTHPITNVSIHYFHFLLTIRNISNQHPDPVLFGFSAYLRDLETIKREFRSTRIWGCFCLQNLLKWRRVFNLLYLSEGIQDIAY